MLSAVRCCAASPCFGRFSLILVILIGFPVRVERPNAVRRICPPPEPFDPSISINSPIESTFQLEVVINCIESLGKC